ncbi:type II toxin-antitoxin system VapC family toxin [Candidatus Woesearchaeota archaeon]|nr:type II toxin-antitoxin system VapC family toxin [Candidatus Woesearchaeota archaeon]
MVRRVCLDSNVLIALLNKDEPTRELLSTIDAQLFTTSIGTFEVWYGRKKSEVVFELLEWLEKLDFDDTCARIAGDIMRDLKSKGKMIDIRDAFIAAICIKNGIELLTYNTKHFERLNEFGLILVDTIGKR